MAIKTINYNESLKYYLKDCNEYFRKECHTNTFQKFFDCNIEEVEKNGNAFKYSIGLLINDPGKVKICYIHSWVEKNGAVIDVTPFANLFITNETCLEGPEYESVKESICEAKYLAIKTISNAGLNKQLQETYYNSRGFLTPGKVLENLVRKWIAEVENDNYVQKQILEFGYNFIED